MMPSSEPHPESGGEIVVFSLLTETACSECSERLSPGSLTRLEERRALCLSCADLDELVYLQRGDAALTRRARKYSQLSAVVLRFSRTRKRYERQAILVEALALERAEQECRSDSDARALARERAADRAARVDRAYVTDFVAAIRDLYPNCPPSEGLIIAERACEKYSGRVGRSAAAKRFDPEAIDLAVQAHIRHRYTSYDQLLARGWGRHQSRAAVVDRVTTVVRQWRKPARTALCK